MSNGLGLDKASKSQGLDVIPAGTLVELVMRIRPGNVGIENLCKRSANGEAEGLDVEYVVRGGEHDGRKAFSFMVLDGTSAGHAKAAEITRGLLRAIFEAVNAIDPSDTSPETVAKLAGASLVGFNGATFLATLEVETGGQRPDGGRYRDKNVIGKVLRIGDKGYRRLEQPPPAPIERTAPPAATAAADNSPMIRPSWAS